MHEAQVNNYFAFENCCFNERLMISMEMKSMNNVNESKKNISASSIGCQSIFDELFFLTIIIIDMHPEFFFIPLNIIKRFMNSYNVTYRCETFTAMCIVKHVNICYPETIPLIT